MKYNKELIEKLREETIRIQYQKVQDLSIWDKLKIWNHYNISHIYLKYTNSSTIHIQLFDEFISIDNLKYRYGGENWIKNGYAKEHMIQAFGIYSWFWRFEKEIGLTNNEKI